MYELRELLSDWRQTHSITTATEIADLLSGLLLTDDLIEDIIDWGRAHKIDNPYKQLNKVTEEIGEIAHEICRDRFGAKLEDAIGDSLVTLIILADIVGLNIYDCLDTAYSEIKDRKGETVDGQFIKANS